MKIESARRQGDELCLTTKDPEAWRWLYDFKPGDYEIRPKRRKRSLDANNYLWALVGQIASAVGMSSDEVYRRAIHEAGVYIPLPIKSEAVYDFSRKWGEKGTGWVVDVLDDSKLPGYKLVRAYYGSSTYDTREMSRLIDYVVQDAKSLDIETLTERELSRLKEEWK